MRNVFFSFVALCLLAGRLCAADSLREGFANPPPEYRVHTWYHWSSNFVTPEGITADLEAMKKAGIGTVHLFAAAMSRMPSGPAILTEKWRENVRHFASEARRLGLQAGVHNCPGWSSSGGPWIRPEDAMQFLVSSEAEVAGGGKRTVTLPQPEIRNGYYRDVALLAFPAAPSPEVTKISATFTKAPSFPLSLPLKEKGSSAELRFDFSELTPLRFAELKFGETHLYVRGEIELSPDGVNFTKAGAFDFGIHNDQRGPKYVPFGDRPVKARSARIRFRDRVRPVWIGPADVRLESVRFTGQAMIPQIELQNASGSSFGFRPPAAGYAAAAGIAPESIIDLTGKLNAAGQLEWEVPPGTWKLLRIGHTPTGKRNAPASLSGLECDKLSRRGLDAHWPGMMEKYLADTKGLDVLRYGIIDSYEVGGQNWTDGLDREFETRRGYPLKPYLPAVLGYAVGTPEESARFLYDFQKTVAELFAENYFGRFTELCRRNGLLSCLEPYGGPFESMQSGKSADLPAGEFWIGGAPPDKLAASIGRVYGKKTIGAEAFTTDALPGRWLQDPYQLKEYGDRAWCRGINLFMLHSYVHQPWLHVRPGVTLGRHGAHFNRNNTWFREAGAWLDYVRRGQYLLQSGQAVADVLVLSGESVPNRFPAENGLDGYDFDYCDVEILLSRLTVRDGRIFLPDGRSYALFSLGTDRYLSRAVLRRVRELLEAGAVVAGVAPLGSPTLADRGSEAEYRRLVADLWESGRYEDRLIPAGKVADAVRALKLAPDFAGPVEFGFQHRRIGARDIYLVSSGSDRSFCGTVSFRVTGVAPELWDPATGETVPAPVWETQGGRTAVQLRLPPKGSIFVVFSPEAGTKNHLLPPAAPVPARLEVVEALYRERDAAAGGAEVTDAVRRLIDDSGLHFPVNTKAFGIADPAPGRYKVLLLKFRGGDGVLHELRTPEYGRVSLDAGKYDRSAALPIEIVRAVYRPRGEENGKDVTDEVKKLFTPAGLDFIVDNPTLGGDPAPDRPKELLLEYAYRGERVTKVYPEWAKVSLSAAFFVPGDGAEPFIDRDGRCAVLFLQPGEAEYRLPGGKIWKAASGVLPEPLALDREWSLSFPPGLGAPERIELPELISWSDHADDGVRYFSGTAVYRRRFELPAGVTGAGRRHYLELGDVKNLARVRLNGADLGLLWKPPFRVEVTERLKPGMNELQVEVTNLLVNRMIGDEQLSGRDPERDGFPEWVLSDRPDSGSGRYTWSTWKGWARDDKPLASGLLGPVRLLTGAVVRQDF